MQTVKMVMLAALFAVSGVSVAGAQVTTVDLCTFPGTGSPVPDGTVLADQWRPIGILFDALPANVDPIKEDFGGTVCHLFFSPDFFDAIAVFSFVEPGTTNPVDATTFELEAWYDPGESAQLVGLDDSSTVVAQDEITPSDIGSESQTLGMSISGTFRTVEWRTQGDPGIAANLIEFEIPGGVPAVPPIGLFTLLIGLVLLGLFFARRVTL